MAASMGSWGAPFMAKSKPCAGLSLRCPLRTSFACPRTAQTHLQTHVEKREGESFGVDSAKCRVSQGHGFQGETQVGGRLIRAVTCTCDQVCRRDERGQRKSQATGRAPTQ